MSKPKSTRCAVARSKVPISTSGGAQESHISSYIHKGGISTGVVVGTPFLSQSATSHRPPAPKSSPKKGENIHSKKQGKEEEEERQDSFYNRDNHSFTKQHEIDEGLLVFLCWHTGRLSNEEFDHYHKTKRQQALRPVLSNIQVEAESVSGADLSITTQRITEEIEALSIGEPSELESILDAVIKRELASPKRLPPPGRKIIKKCIFSTWSSLIRDPDPGMERYKEIYATGWKDPTKEWLLDLKIPCSIVYTKNYKPMDLDSSPEVDPDQSFSSNSDSSFSLLDDDEENFEGEGVSEPGEMEAPMRASSMTLGDMMKCGWVFYDELPEVGTRKTPTSTTYKKSQEPLRDITVRPREPMKPRKSGERDQKLLGLHSKLLIEIHGQIDEVSSSILYLPEHWKFIGKMKPRLPELVFPDEYKSAIEELDMKQSSSKNHGTSKSRATPPISSIKKSPSVQNGTSSQSSPSEEFVQQSTLGNDLYKLLRKKFPLTGQSAKDGCQAKELEKAINGWNIMPRYINCTSELWNTLERLPGTSGNIIWLSDEEMIQQDRMHRSGIVVMNERIHNCAILEQGIIRDFLLYSSSRDALSEGEVESGSGAILQKFISGDGIE
ncbi:hypothetical protein CPB86DRAFT_798493 [Serendipita vermifera]|nr:hypothetical protein CPB86DRAFT_798493 [Serendipita vermifera]